MRTRVLWLVPLFFALHNLEEWLALQTFLPLLGRRAPLLADHLPSITQYGVALIVISILPFVFALLRQVYLLVITQAVVAINVVSHVVAALLFRGYTPGLLTAVAINLPFSLYFFRKLRESGTVRGGRVRRIVPIAILLHGPVLVGLLWWLGRSR